MCLQQIASHRSSQHKSDLTVFMSLVQCKSARKLAWQKHYQAQVVQKVDNTVHQINHYPADNLVCFVNTYMCPKGSNLYPVDSVISSLLTTWARPIMFNLLLSHIHCF